MFSRKQYMDRECTHREYYGQFVREYERQRILTVIGLERLLRSTDEHLNDIPLGRWDTLAPGPKAVSDKVKEAGDFTTLAGWVCIYKEAARQLIEETEVSDAS